MFAAVGVYGLSTLVFALSRSMVLSVLALAILGAADMVSVFVRQTLVQIVTPDAMRGRVSAVSSLFIGASNELGEFESGGMARLLGPVGSAIFGGCGAILVTLLWAGIFPGAAQGGQAGIGDGRLVRLKSRGVAGRGDFRACSQNSATGLEHLISNFSAKA